jgi:hypothetical protein
MYVIQAEPEANWVWHFFRGLRRLVTRGFAPESFASIGTGSGIDAIGAARIVPTLRRVVVTDIDPSIVDLAAENVRRNVRPDVTVVGYVGDVCYPLYENGERIDVLYANLPNIPDSLGTGDIADRGTFHGYRDLSRCDRVITKYLLGLQYAFLRSSRLVMSRNGAALLLIGGRIPWQALDTLAASTGFEFDEVLSAFKRQTEAEQTTRGYAMHEKEVEFDFYRLAGAEQKLGGGIELNGRQLKERLAPLRMSAAEAQVVVARGEAVGHTLHMIRATMLGRGE